MTGAADDTTGPELDAVLRAARVLVGISARSVAAVDDVVTLPQLRILVMVASSERLNVTAVAAELGVHPSNATRAVDRLVGDGLLDRHESAADRRNLELALTLQGRRLVEQVMDHRRSAVSAILQRLDPDRRRCLADALLAFAAEAGDELADTTAWSLGWTTA